MVVNADTWNILCARRNVFLYSVTFVCAPNIDYKKKKKREELHRTKVKSDVGKNQISSIKGSNQTAATANIEC